MALPKMRAENSRSRGGRVAGQLDDATGGGTPGGSEHDYSDDSRAYGGSGSRGEESMEHNSPASKGAYRGPGPLPGAGENDYGNHGTPGRAAARKSGMNSAAYPSRPIPDSNVGKMLQYKEGNPPPADYRYPAAPGKPVSGNVGKNRSSSTY